MNVTDMPFFVIQIDEIEVACFERMYANIRNFDLTFIYKDFERFIRVLSIPI
jgi:nucleosome binding factor SPN SPT16 subunit